MFICVNVVETADLFIKRFLKEGLLMNMKKAIMTKHYIIIVLQINS